MDEALSDGGELVYYISNLFNASRLGLRGGGGVLKLIDTLVCVNVSIRGCVFSQIFERPRRGVRKIILSTSIAETR